PHVLLLKPEQQTKKNEPNKQIMTSTSSNPNRVFEKSCQNFFSVNPSLTTQNIMKPNTMRKPSNEHYHLNLFACLPLLACTLLVLNGCGAVKGRHVPKLGAITGQKLPS